MWLSTEGDTDMGILDKIFKQGNIERIFLSEGGKKGITKTESIWKVSPKANQHLEHRPSLAFWNPYEVF